MGHQKEGVLKYHKIETVFERDEKFKVIPWRYRDRCVEALAGLEWAWTEKLNGTNIRVIWDPARFLLPDDGMKAPAVPEVLNPLSFSGKTDDAMIHPQLLNALRASFPAEALNRAFGPDAAVLYGEGVGAKIQRGGDYCDGHSFVLFDVWRGVWLERDAVNDVAVSLGIPSAPVVLRGSIESAVAYVRGNPQSAISVRPRPMEGLVGRPPVELQDKQGRRVIVKIKARDFA